MVKEPTLQGTSLENLPEGKRNEILHHKFAFVCYKDPKSAMRAVNEVPYYKIEDKKYNTELDNLVVKLRNYNVVPEE